MVIVASLSLAVAALAVSPQPAEQQAVAPARQAQATVTIVSAATIRFAELERSQPELLRDTQVDDADGSTQPARLVEFE